MSSEIHKHGPVGHLLEKAREYLTHWTVGGIIVALTGFAPDHWVAHLVENPHLPEWLTHDYRMGAVTLGVAIVVANIMVKTWWSATPEGARPSASPEPLNKADAAPIALNKKPSIAVLPFLNMSGDPEQDYFSDGISEDIITDLSKLSGVFVVGRQSSFIYKGKSIGLRQIGLELGVRFILEGSVRRAGDRLRITTQLVEAEGNGQIWAERYDRKLEDIFAVQEEVARKVVDVLAVRLMPEENDRLGHIPTQNLDAYESFKRGRTAVHPPTKENLAHGRKLFESTVALDPGFAGGYAGLSYIDSVSMTFGHVPRTPERLQQAKTLAQKAIALDPKFGWSQTVLAWAMWAGEAYDEAIAAARRAVALQPGDAETHGMLGLILTFAGEANEAISQTEQAIQLTPRGSGIYLNFFAYANAMAGNHETAITTLNQIVPGAYSPVTYSMLILAYVESGNIEEAKDMGELALKHYPQLTTSSWIAVTLKRHDDMLRVAKALRTAGIPDQTLPQTD